MNDSANPARSLRWPLLFLAAFGLVLAWSAVHPKDTFTWFLEVVPALAGSVILIWTYRRFRFTTLVYAFLALHAMILAVGGHYTYAEVPLFDWLRDALHLSRNHYDRLGHFAQGFVPALVTREFLLRNSTLRTGKLLAFLVICVCLAISAGYELLEWGVAEATGTAADAFLGTQGDVWDTQWDMALNLVGAVTALATLTKVHDRLIQKIMPASGGN